jgi:hypothetical protein
MFKNSEPDYISLFLDFYERYSELTYEERGRLVWAMLAYARNEDPAPHLTDDLRRLAFGNEKGIIDRTGKAHAGRKEQRRAVAKAAANARWHSEKNANGDADACKRMQTYANACNPCHNNNYNKNNNNNKNNNKEGTRTHGGAGQRASDAHAVGQEIIFYNEAIQGRLKDGGGEAPGSLQPGPG